MVEIILWATVLLVWTAGIYHIIVVRQWQQLGKRVQRDIDAPAAPEQEASKIQN